MITITDIHGKAWKFREEDVEEIFFDNSHPNDWVIIRVGQARIKTFRWALAVALPKVVEEIPLSYDTNRIISEEGSLRVR